MKAFLYLMRRELWEHRALWIVPACVGAMMVLTAIAGVAFTGYVSRGAATGQILKLSEQERAEHRRELAEARRDLQEAVRELRAEIQADGGAGGEARLKAGIAELLQGVDQSLALAEKDPKLLDEALSRAEVVVEKSTEQAGDTDAGKALAELGGRLGREIGQVAREKAIVTQLQLHADDSGATVNTRGALVVDGKVVTLRDLLERYAALSGERRASEVRKAVFGTAAVFYMFVFVTVFFYALDSLYAERKDRSALFWKSLPVSDLATVLSKAATAVVSAALLTFACVVLTQALIMLLLSVVVAWHGLSVWELVWKPAGVYAAWPLLLLVYPVLGLWMLPVYAWAMMVSAWVRRSPLVVAVLVPLAVILLENWILGTQFLSNAISTRFARFADLTNVAVQVDADVAGKAIVLHPGAESFHVSAVGDLLMQPAFWVGLLLSAALLTAAVWIRRYRDET